MKRQVTRFRGFSYLNEGSALCFCSDDAMINLSFGVPVGDQHNQHRRLQEGASWHLDEAPFIRVSRVMQLRSSRVFYFHQLSSLYKWDIM